MTENADFRSLLPLLSFTCCVLLVWVSCSALQGATYMLIKARAELSIVFTFNSGQLDHSAGPIQIPIQTEDTNHLDFNIPASIIVKKPLFEFDPRTDASNINFEVSMRERQIVPRMIGLRNRGLVPVTCTVDLGSSNTFIEVNRESGMLELCECPTTLAGILCGSEEYYQNMPPNGCTNNEVTLMFSVNAMMLEPGAYSHTFSIHTNDQERPRVDVNVQVEVLPNLLVISQTSVNIPNVGPSQSKGSMLTLSNFYYNKALVDTFGNDCKVAFEKTLNSTVKTEVGVNATLYPWLQVKQLFLLSLHLSFSSFE